MHVAVVGVGGVGGFFGGKLAQAGCDVTFVARGKTAEALAARGLRVQSVDGDFEIPKVQVAERLTRTADVVIVGVKAWQIAEAVESIRPAIGPDTVVIPLQNGIDAPDELVTLVGRDHAAGGLCAVVSFVVEPGVIRHAGGSAYIMFGELDNRPSPRLEKLRDAFRAARISADIPPDIHKSMWSKFVFIAPLSGVGAVTRVPIGIFRSVPESRQMLLDGIGEVLAVAKAKGVPLDDDMLAKTMERYDGLPPDATSSLQRDVMAGKPSEIDAQLGAVVRLGRETGVATPVHRFLYHALLPAENVSRRS